MPKILIIYPHFPPSNLAGVHRPRLFAQHLPSFGWEPIVLTVDEKYYEEEPDYNLVKLLPGNLRIEKVKAFKITRPRLVGDIGLRAFFQLYKKAKELIRKERIDFLYIPVPSFYCALIGRWLHTQTEIKYGIDYIDPWVHRFPGSNKKFSRHWFSTRMAKMLEPIAVKKASLITGVAEGYYLPVLERNPHLKTKAITGAMPYGSEKEDVLKMKQLDLQPYLFSKKKGKIQFVYAGAMLPKAYSPLEAIFQSIVSNREIFENTEFHFIGTGRSSVSPFEHSIKPVAEKYGLWQTIVFEYPARIPYLDVLTHLGVADAIFILGSTEAHYTPSKIYQGVLSRKPILAVLHSASAAIGVLENSHAAMVFGFAGNDDIESFARFPEFFGSFVEFYKQFNPETINGEAFEQYSAYSATRTLADLLQQVNDG